MTETERQREGGGQRGRDINGQRVNEAASRRRMSPNLRCGRESLARLYLYVLLLAALEGDQEDKKK